MAALTQLDPFADTSGEDTVVNLFRAGSTVFGLTQWGRDYPTALYGSLTNRATDRMQVNEIVPRLTRTRGESGRSGETAEEAPAPDERARLGRRATRSADDRPG